jgi:hypothetical protein
MKSESRDQRMKAWANAGKVLTLITAISGALYGSHAGIDALYNSGIEDGREQGNEKTKKNLNPKITALERKVTETEKKNTELKAEVKKFRAAKEDLRVIPKKSCIRYFRTIDDVEQLGSQGTECEDNFRVSLTQGGKKRQITRVKTDLGEYRGIINTQGIQSFQKQKQQFIPYQRK